MSSITKYIFPVFLMLFCNVIVKAQQNSSELPSLINNNDKNVEAALKQKMFVKVLTSKNKIFVGEPVMATYKFYVAMHITDQPTVIKQPEFSGCSVKELDFEQGPDFENIGKELYAVYTIRKVQLTPLQQGMLSLGNAIVSNTVQLPESSDPYTVEKHNITVSNADDSVEVIELPEKNKPGNFYGITGEFNISAIVSSNKIPVDENGHLIVTIKGSGNFDAINKPEITWPGNTEHFDGSDSQHVNQDNFPISGNRIFDIPFIGKKTGTIIIPPISFSFFNTMSENYQTVTTDSIPVTFTKALARKNEFPQVINYDITNRKYLWIVPALAIVVAIIGFVSFKRNKSQMQTTKPGISVTTAPVFVQPQPDYHVKYRTDFSRYLSELESVTENKQFFEKSKNLLTKAVAERIDSIQYSEEVLLMELKERTYNAPVCNKVSALYEAFNLNLYAPFKTQADLEFYFNELKDTIEKLQSDS